MDPCSSPTAQLACYVSLECLNLTGGVDVLQEAQEILSALQDDINPQRVIGQTLASLPGISRQAVLQWSDKVLAS